MNENIDMLDQFINSLEMCIAFVISGYLIRLADNLYYIYFYRNTEQEESFESENNLWYYLKWYIKYLKLYGIVVLDIKINNTMKLR